MAAAGAAAGAGLLGVAKARAGAPADFDALVERALALYGAPGVAIATVSDGQVTLAKGYGRRRLGQANPADAHTAFPIASLTKGITCAAIALLVDEGKLGWDDKVADRLPGFQLYDPIATRQMTVADLLAHRSGLGLGEGDLMLFPPTDFSRAELVSKLRFLKPATEFRSGFAYDNVLYIAAGELIGAVAGVPWEVFVQSRLLEPLGMADAVASQERLRGENRSALHARIGGPVRGVGPLQPIQGAPGAALTNPAGGVWASATDMGRWMQAQLAHGKLPDGRRLWSDDSAQRMWRPLSVVDVSLEGHAPITEPHFVLSALGWAVLDYRGETVVMHAGELPGAVSRLMLLPARGYGLCILTNAEEETLHEALAYSLLDHELGLPTRDYVGEGKVHDDARAARRLARAKTQVLTPPAAAKPPGQPLAAYAGTYRSDWYGDVRVTTTQGGLRIDFTRTPAMKGTLQPWDGETFITRFAARDTEDALVTFTAGPDGRISGAELKAASPSADFSYDFQDLGLKRVA